MYVYISMSVMGCFALWNEIKKNIWLTKLRKNNVVSSGYKNMILLFLLTFNCLSAVAKASLKIFMLNTIHTVMLWSYEVLESKLWESVSRYDPVQSTTFSQTCLFVSSPSNGHPGHKHTGLKCKFLHYDLINSQKKYLWTTLYFL